MFTFTFFYSFKSFFFFKHDSLVSRKRSSEWRLWWLQSQERNCWNIPKVSAQVQNDVDFHSLLNNILWDIFNCGRIHFSTTTFIYSIHFLFVFLFFVFGIVNFRSIYITCINSKQVKAKEVNKYSTSLQIILSFFLSFFLIHTDPHTYVCNIFSTLSVRLRKRWPFPWQRSKTPTSTPKKERYSGY